MIENYSFGQEELVVQELQERQHHGHHLPAEEGGLAMSKYAVYEIFGDSAPYNVEFCGHLAGALVGTSDKNPLSRQHDGVHDSVNEIETKLSKYDSMAREATKQLKESGFAGLKVVASWDSDNGVDAFYLKRVVGDVKYNLIELWECRHCQNVMALASFAIAAASSLGF